MKKIKYIAFSILFLSMIDKDLSQVKALKVILLLNEFNGEINKSLFQKCFNNKSNININQIVKDLFLNLNSFIEELGLEVRNSEILSESNRPSWSAVLEMSNEMTECVFDIDCIINNINQELRLHYRLNHYRRYILEQNISMFLDIFRTI